MLHVTVYTYDTTDGSLVQEVSPEKVDYISLFNPATHGPPALVAPGRQDGRPIDPVARPGDEVLYINTALVPMFKVRREDEN